MVCSDNLSGRNVPHNCHGRWCRLQCFSAPWPPWHLSTYSSLLRGKLLYTTLFALHCWKDNCHCSNILQVRVTWKGLLASWHVLSQSQASSDLQWPGIWMSLVLFTIVFSIPSMRLVSSKGLVSWLPLFLHEVRRSHWGYLLSSWGHLKHHTSYENKFVQ